MWMTTGGRLRSLALLAALLPGCQPLADFRTKIRFPADTDVPLDVMHYRIGFRGRDVEREPGWIRSEDSGLLVEYHFHDVGPVMLTVWADLDGDGAKSPGDLVGQFDREFMLRDAGPCSLGYTKTSDIVLEPWTP